MTTIQRIVRVLGLLAWIVPARDRNSWLSEWTAELAYHLEPTNNARRTRPRRWLAARLLAAAQHAIWLRWTGGRRAGEGPRRAGVWTGLSDDFRSTYRGWRRTPIFSATVIMTLTLAVGLVSAILSFADGYLFRPLMFPGADRTYYVADPAEPIAGALKASEVIALRQSNVSTYGFVEWSSSEVRGDLQVADRRVEVSAYEVSPGFRKTLALPLAAGRDFEDDDHRGALLTSAWLTYGFWQRALGGDGAVVGRVFQLSLPRGTRDLRVVGILGQTVSTLDLNNPPPDIVVPAEVRTSAGRNELSFPLVLLPEGVTVEHASTRIAAELQAAAPAAVGLSRTVKLRSLQDAQLAGGKPTARVLFAGSILVFLLASMNLVHLLLGRGASRTAEVATRVALGASRWRIVRAFLVESALLGIAGTACGLLVGHLLSDLIAARVPAFPTAGRNLAMVPMVFDGRIMAISAMLGLLAAGVGGLWPAARAWRGSLAVSTRSGSAVSLRLARVILASELSVVTVVAVGVVFVSLGIFRYLNQPLGFDYVDRFRVTVQPPDRRLAGADAVSALHAVRSSLGITAAGLESTQISGQGIEVPGRAVDTTGTATQGVGPGLFEAWGMKMSRGRWFDASEFPAADTVVVNERFATMAWPDGDAVGATLRTGVNTRRVVGVVADQRWQLHREPTPTLFVPLAESAGRSPIVAWVPDLDLTDIQNRLTTAMAIAVPGARVTVKETTFDTLFARSVGEARFQAPLVLGFGVLAASLALIGVFGIVSFLVHQRTREFGIRIALGARRVDIWTSVVRESLGPAACGLAVGSFGAWALESVMRSTVFGWQSSGFLAVAFVAGGLLFVAVIAAAGPASRAARIDPAVSLRVE